jgi:hypothetical protein
MPNTDVEASKVYHHSLNSIGALAASKGEKMAVMTKTAGTFGDALKIGKFVAGQANKRMNWKRFFWGTPSRHRGVRAAKAVGRGALGGLGLFAKGLRPVAKTAPFGEKVFGVATKATALGGAGVGAYAGHKALTRPQSTANYNTFLRNNILAGRIQPSQLNRQELVAVRKLGLN